MNKTIEEQLATAKHIAQDATTKRIQFETKLEASQNRKTELLAKCAELNVKPEELPKKILELEHLVQEGMAELNGLLSTEETVANDLPY